MAVIKQETTPNLENVAPMTTPDKPDRRFVNAVVEQNKIQCRVRLQRARPWRGRFAAASATSGH